MAAKVVEAKKDMKANGTQAPNSPGYGVKRINSVVSEGQGKIAKPVMANK